MNNNSENDNEKKIGSLVDHIFRHQASRIVATLTSIFGIENFELVEDVVQETLLTALKRWGYRGVPENPQAWLMKVAKNRALDILRRNNMIQAKRDDITQRDSHLQISSKAIEVGFGNEILDDQLRLMFTCSHPNIPEDSREALTLKLLCSFSVSEIARAFLTSESTIAQRIVRAKKRFKSGTVPFEIPAPSELSERLDSVLTVLYLLYNEGYSANAGGDLVRYDLCTEAIRLTTLLTDHSAGNKPHVHALLATMLLQSSRFGARSDKSDRPILLQDQDRALWDKQLISRGFSHLEMATSGDQLGQYHLQAGIAACHTGAESWETTDWKQIVEYYDYLVKLTDSPVHLLNRAVAFSMLHGPQSGMNELESLSNHSGMKRYYLYHATRGELLSKLKSYDEATLCFEKAADLAGSDPEKRLLNHKASKCRALQ